MNLHMDVESSGSHPPAEADGLNTCGRLLSTRLTRSAVAKVKRANVMDSDEIRGSPLFLDAGSMG